MDILQNIKPRQYQEDIAKTCLKKNTLVVLPTGIGKTLIALMVAVERQKQFPLEKILILAPTKPLAEQHLISFKKILPNLWADIQLFTGSVKAEQRKKIWETADIIFSTPQCIANDLKNRLYDLKKVSLLVEDEAHRCIKNYDYNFIAKKYLEQSKNTRILGLTASPGGDSKKIKEICRNLSIEEVELRTRDSPDVKEYLQELDFEKRMLKFPPAFEEIRSTLKKIYTGYTDELRMRNFLFGNDSKIALIELQKKITSQLARNFKSFDSYKAMSSCAQAIKIAHAIELLETQTLESFHTYLKNLQSQADKKQSKGVVGLVAKQGFHFAFIKSFSMLEKGIEHPKVNELFKIIEEGDKKEKIIIFTQFRETATILSKKINQIRGIKSKVFVGQAKKEGVGLSQKDQKQMIDEFSSGEINVICATCIAEEGLDIPEVGTVIFYEPVSSAIRSIQRRGRTARLSKGKLIILITEKTKDEISYYSSRAREKKMEKSIGEIKKEMALNGNLKKDTTQKKLG